MHPCFDHNSLQMGANGVNGDSLRSRYLTGTETRYQALQRALLGASQSPLRRYGDPGCFAVRSYRSSCHWAVETRSPSERRSRQRAPAPAILLPRCGRWALGFSLQPRSSARPRVAVLDVRRITQMVYRYAANTQLSSGEGRRWPNTGISLAATGSTQQS